MSIIDTIRATLFGAPLSLPLTEAIGGSRFGAVGAFMDLDDPTLIPFLRDGRETSSGIVINERRALSNSSMFRAASLISSSIGMLPCPLHKKVRNTRQVEKDDGTSETVTSTGAERATDHPVYRLLMKKPNAWMTPFEFKTYMVQR